MKWVTALAASAALLLPAVAHAGDVSMHVLHVPDGPRSLSLTAPSTHFNMLGEPTRRSSGRSRSTRRA